MKAQTNPKSKIKCFISSKLINKGIKGNSKVFSWTWKEKNINVIDPIKRVVLKYFSVGFKYKITADGRENIKVKIVEIFTNVGVANIWCHFITIFVTNQKVGTYS